ncbi:DUF4184 family protein [Streptomyces sp. NBC_01320]|uniref:DUF4184 family protein n=1 Tax=Streptomyces sp. NBC_01320 TaxID=2903824 RepID=UPI002E12D2CA|nr:DUF4184 family protein [Streptomyces sp. NBC_01320]
MPFTLSHAAAVLPVIRRNGTGRGPLLASALVAGSFAPDMTYYADTAIPGAMEFGEVTHAVWGVFTVDVLITAALVALWLLLREPLVALLPQPWQGRVHTFVRGERQGPRGARDIAWFVLSAVLGAGSHVVWDAFTHHDRWGTRLVPVLSGSAGGFPVFQLVQYGSSAVALTVLGWFTVSGLRRTGTRPAPRSVPVLDHRDRWYAGALLSLCVLLGIVHRCARWYAYFGHIDTPLDIIPTACFGAGAGLAVGLVLYAAWIRLRERKQNRPPTGTGEPGRRTGLVSSPPGD